MPRDGNGVYNLPANSWNPAVEGTEISAPDWNDTADDLSNAVTNSIASDGQTVTVAAIPFAFGIETDEIGEATSDAGVTIDGVLLKDASVSTDTINEKTLDAGVTVDGVLNKDGIVTMADPTTPSKKATFSLSGISSSTTRTITVPDANLTLVGTDTVQTLTNKTLTGNLGAVPVGAGMDWWGSSAPTGWIFAYGQAISRSTYSALFALYGTTYGSGDGSTTFNVPDKRGRASFGKDDMGGSAANRLTNSATGGINGSALGNSGGEQAHVLTVAELAAHTHAYARINTPNAGIQGTGAVSWGPVQDNTLSTGDDDAHNTVPPGIVCNYIIYAGA